jgi:hypothetical protein
MVVKGIGRIIRFETAYAGQELFVVAGFLMIIGTLIKLLGFVDFSSDWFWFLAGIGLMIEGMIMVTKQKKFNKKYKVVERVEEVKV